MRMHQTKILYIFVPDLSWGNLSVKLKKKLLFNQNLGQYSVMATQKLIG